MGNCLKWGKTPIDSSWEQANKEMKYFMKKKHKNKKYQELKDMKGGNGYPFSINNELFVKVQLKRKGAEKNLQQLQNIKTHAGSGEFDTGYKRLCLLKDFYESSDSIILIYPKLKCDLSQYLNKHRENIKPKSRDKILLSILDAIMYLHSKGYAHRDIKLENILLLNDEHAVLCDLEHAYNVTEFGMKGTKEYYPTPNVVNTLLQGRQDLSTAQKMKWLDYYAFGKTVAMVMCMTQPFKQPIKVIWTNWCEKQRSSAFPYSSFMNVLAIQHMWWDCVYKLCINNEKAVYNNFQKLFDLNDIKILIKSKYNVY